MLTANNWKIILSRKHIMSITGAGVIVVNKSKKNEYADVLLILETGGRFRGHYNDIGGDIDPHETPLKCAVRELMEETYDTFTIKESDLSENMSIMAKTTTGNCYKSYLYIHDDENFSCKTYYDKMKINVNNYNRETNGLSRFPINLLIDAFKNNSTPPGFNYLDSDGNLLFHSFGHKVPRACEVIRKMIQKGLLNSGTGMNLIFSKGEPSLYCHHLELFFINKLPDKRSCDLLMKRIKSPCNDVYYRGFNTSFCENKQEVTDEKLNFFIEDVNSESGVLIDKANLKKINKKIDGMYYTFYLYHIQNHSSFAEVLRFPLNPIIKRIKSQKPLGKKLCARKGTDLTMENIDEYIIDAVYEFNRVGAFDSFVTKKTKN